MRGTVHRPGRERAQWMTFIIALPLYIHTHPITAGLIDQRTFLFPAPECFSPFCSNYTTRCFHSCCSTAPVPGLQSELFIKDWGDIFRKEEVAVVLLEKTPRQPPLWGRPFAGSHSLGIIRIYVHSSIPPHRLLSCRGISGQGGSLVHDSSRVRLIRMNYAF